MMDRITYEAVENLLQTYVASAKQGDANAVARLYASNAVVISGGQLWAQGRSDIHERLAGEFAQPDRSEMQVQTDTCIISRDGLTAFVDESFTEADGTKGCVRMWLELGTDRDVYIREEWIILI